jgi:hypothetical protein
MITAYKEENRLSCGGNPFHRVRWCCSFEYNGEAMEVQKPPPLMYQQKDFFNSVKWIVQ